VKRLCTLLDATIELGVSDVQGTTFTISFPLQYEQSNEQPPAG
jgi:uncharacterized protein YggE